MPTKPPRDPEAPSGGPSPRRHRLLTAAERLLHDAGPHALSLRRIAELAETSTQAVYTEFGGKHGLADALYLEGYRRLTEALEAVPPANDPLERIHALGMAYRDNALANPHLYALMTGRPVPEFEPPVESRRRARGSFRILVEAIDEARAAGALANVESRHLAHLLWAAGHGYVGLALHGLEQDDDPDRTYRQLTEAILDRFRPTMNS